MKKKQVKCYAYIRVSTLTQADNFSLDAQREKLYKYAEYQDMIIAGEYADEGFSGKNIQGRQGFKQMLDDIQSGKDDVEYVLVFKLSRFGRNAADVLYSLQLMQDFGVNLICVEDGIDSSKDAGKLMISVLSAVAEIERENIRVQTMAGREQKAREGKWNGGFTPYGYKLVNNELLIADDEVEIIKIIFDRYIHTSEGISGVANYLNNHGYTKKLRQNNTIPGFSASFVKDVIDNPVYMGKIAYGRRRTEKKVGTRNEMHVVEQSEFPIYEGQHETIISAMVNKPVFVNAIKEKIGTAIDTKDMETELETLRGQLRQIIGTKNRLEKQMDSLDVSDKHYERKVLDLQRRYDEQYDRIEEIEVQIDELKNQIQSIRQEKISGDNIYQLLLMFDKVYYSYSEVEQKEFMKAFIEKIELYPEKRKDGCWIKHITFNFPIPLEGKEVTELCLEKETTLEAIVSISLVDNKKKNG